MLLGRTNRGERVQVKRHEPDSKGAFEKRSRLPLRIPNLLGLPAAHTKKTGEEFPGGLTASSNNFRPL